MTDDEFERIKESEKNHLRSKKRLRRTLEALKQRDEVQGVVERMRQGAQRLLDETESLVDSLRHSVARREARLETALDDEPVGDEDLREEEEILREKRAEALVRRMKAEEANTSRPQASPDAEASADEDSEDSQYEGPDKTIGRMDDLGTEDAS
jgi:hypothetical protein